MEARASGSNGDGGEEARLGVGGRVDAVNVSVFRPVQRLYAALLAGLGKCLCDAGGSEEAGVSVALLQPAGMGAGCIVQAASFCLRPLAVAAHVNR